MDEAIYPSLGEALAKLQERRVTSVEFVEDYFQVLFGDARLSVLGSASLEAGEQSIASEDADFRRLLQDCVGATLVSAESTPDRLVFRFSPHLALRIELLEESAGTEQLLFEDGTDRK